MRAESVCFVHLVGVNLFSKVGRASSSLHEIGLSAISMNNSPVVQTVEYAVATPRSWV